MLNSPVDEIKARLDIVDVIQGYIKLQKAGANFRALCPFHNEKNPSFFVSPSKQIWHCFSCGKGGDIFSFVMEMDGCEFRDALRILANKAGVELRREDPKVQSEKSKIYEICSTATSFFEEKLKVAPEVQKYLGERGFKKETMENFRLGWAPSEWRALSGALIEQGYKIDDIEKAGLAIKKDGKYYDRFRSRIIFPIMDLHGEIIGFGGRIFRVNPLKFPRESASTDAKYINSPQTLIYDKSKVLYGLDKAKTEIRRENRCIVVEGYTDVIASYQAGIGNVVSSSGTALTEEQLRVLKRYAESLVLAFDQDLAGQEATKRGINLAIGFGFNTKIVPMPKDKDPADCIRKNPKGWKEMIGKAQGIIDFYFKDTFSRVASEKVEGKKEIAKTLLPVLKRIPDKIEQAYWLGILSQKLGVEERFLAEAMNLVKIDSTYYQREKLSQEKRRTKSRIEGLEERLLGFLFVFPKKAKIIDKDLFTVPTLVKMFEELQKFRKDKPSFREFQKSLSSEQSMQVRLLAFKAEEEAKTEDIDIKKEVKNCISELKKEKLRQQLKELSLKVRRAEENKDKVVLETLTKEFNKVSKEYGKTKNN